MTYSLRLLLILCKTVHVMMLQKAQVGESSNLVNFLLFHCAF